MTVRTCLGILASAVKTKTVIFLGDGMADEPVDELNGLTPLEHAHTPAMDSIAKDGCCGSLLTLPPGFPTGSDVANMSILGCSLAAEYCGRGPLEAAGLGITLSPSDIAFRVNLVTVTDGILRDFTGGHISDGEAAELIREVNSRFGSEHVQFYPGAGYRAAVVLSGSGHSHLVRTGKPDNHQGEYLSDNLPEAEAAAAEETAALMRRLMLESPDALERTPVNAARRAAGRPMANSLWAWSGGKMGSVTTLKEKYGVSGAVISAVPVIKGLGRCLGMDVIEVEGATGYLDTNYEGKAQAAIEALSSHDLVYLHVEAIDEVSHEKDLAKKLQAIEDFDSRIVGPVLDHFGTGINAAVLPDHPVPVAHGKHTRTPVPVAVRMNGMAADNVQSFGESHCQNGSLGLMTGAALMEKLFLS